MSYSLYKGTFEKTVILALPFWNSVCVMCLFIEETLINECIIVTLCTQLHGVMVDLRHAVVDIDLSSHLVSVLTLSRIL